MSYIFFQYMFCVQLISIEMNRSVRRKLFVGTVETLFEIDNGENESEISEKNWLNDGMDDELAKCCDLLEEKKTSEWHNDGMNDSLIECYESVKKTVENCRALPKTLHYLLENSPKTIEKNKLLAKIRLVENRIRWSAKFRSDMSDYFFNIESWPSYAIKILFSSDFDYADRIGLACFLHGNGLKDKDKALCIFQFYNDFWKHDKRWKTKFYKFQSLFDYLETMNKSSDEGLRMRSTYYYYDIQLNLTMYYDGTVRTAKGGKRFYYDAFGRN